MKENVHKKLSNIRQFSKLVNASEPKEPEKTEEAKDPEKTEEANDPEKTDEVELLNYQENIVMKDLLRLKANSHQIEISEECKKMIDEEVEHLRKINKQEEIVIRGEDSIKSEESSEGNYNMLSDISSIDSDVMNKIV
jgi:predicted flavoprotein YhiN